MGQLGGTYEDKSFNNLIYFSQANLANSKLMAHPLLHSKVLVGSGEVNLKTINIYMIGLMKLKNG